MHLTFASPVRLAEMTPSRVSRGFALLWVLVMIAILASLAAAAAPYLRTNLADKRAVDSTAQMLREIGVGMNAMELAIARKFPGRPSELTNSLTQVGAYRIMSCWNNSYSGADSTTYAGLTGGTFLSFYVPTNGLWTPIGRLRDSVENRAGNQNSAFLWLDIPAVHADVAEMMDLAVDGTINNAADTVQYNTPVNDTTTLRFRVTPREFSKC